MPEPVTICSIVGTRPEAIKMAPIIARLARLPAVRQKVVLTGQHKELLHSALAMFDLRPDIDLALMQENQTLAELNARALSALDAVYQRERPQWVVVQGDTTTAFAAALAAFYRQIKIAHVEAGLRTDDIYNPFPEEVNRRFIDQISTLHFAPTTLARENLLRDGISPNSILVTGNSGIDALLDVAARNMQPPPEVALARRQASRLILVTAHRRENFGAPLRGICQALASLARRNREVAIVYAVHPNPNVSRPVHEMLSGVERVFLAPAVDYERFVGFMKACDLILTDSGGIQEEAPSLGKPVLVLRQCTERTEAVDAGTAKLVGTNPEIIVREAETLLHDAAAYERMSRAPNPFGDGKAAERIVAALLAFPQPVSTGAGAGGAGGGR
jgi:UDP-N-acetylglucosamine 2-epimerase (non-hydrolysing)